MNPRAFFPLLAGARALLAPLPSAIMFSCRIKAAHALFFLGLRDLGAHQRAQLRAAAIFKSARFPPSALRLAPSPPLWGAAIRPADVYREPPAELAPHADIDNRMTRLFMLHDYLTLSCHTHYVESLKKLESLDGRPPVDQAMGSCSWSIGADEELDGSHPCVAIAYFQRLADAELRLNETLAWSVSPEAIEPLGMRLALAMMGDAESLCGICPTWMDRFDQSLFASNRLGLTLESARLILPVLLERRALETDISPSARHAREARL